LRTNCWFPNLWLGLELQKLWCVEEEKLDCIIYDRISGAMFDLSLSHVGSRVVFVSCALFETGVVWKESFVLCSFLLFSVFV